MKFGEKIKMLREEKQMSLAEFAEVLGTSKQVLSRYERGENTPKITTVMQYAEALGVQPSFLMDDKTTCNIYERIKKLRIQLGMSQAELAKRVGYEGRSAISKVENGERDISQSMIMQYAQALNVTPFYLLYGDDSQCENFSNVIYPAGEKTEGAKIGEIIQNYLTSHNLTQRQFAKKCGLSNGYISMLINNINPKTGKPIAPSLLTLTALARGLDTTLDKLIDIANQEVTTASSLSNESIEMMQLFAALPFEKQKQALDYTRYLSMISSQNKE